MCRLFAAASIGVKLQWALQSAQAFGRVPIPQLQVVTHNGSVQRPWANSDAFGGARGKQVICWRRPPCHMNFKSKAYLRWLKTSLFLGRCVRASPNTTEGSAAQPWLANATLDLAAQNSKRSIRSSCAIDIRRFPSSAFFGSKSSERFRHRHKSIDPMAASSLSLSPSSRFAFST